MTSWGEKRIRLGDDTTVSELLSTAILQKRRFYVKRIVEVICFLIENQLPFRGDWDAEEHREAIQNELISIIAKLIEEDVVKDINSADVDFFTILVDGTKDRIHFEVVSVAVRYVLNGKALESLLGFLTTKELDADSMTELILSKISNAGLDSHKILSQCYDGAKVISGNNGGIRRIIQNKIKRLIPYVHCINHRLHLVVIASINGVYLAKSFFENVKLIYSFFRRTKVQAAYNGKSILNQSYKRRLRKPSEDRGYTVGENNNRKFDADDIAVATGMKQAILKVEFLFMVTFMKEFLNYIAPADRILQSRDVGFREALPIIDDVIRKVLGLQSISEFECILKRSEELLSESPGETRLLRKKSRPSSLAAFIITENVGERNDDVNVELKSAFNEIIDIFQSQMNRRFGENSKILTAISEAQELCYEKLLSLKQLGIKLPSREELSVAKTYLERLKREHDKKERAIVVSGGENTFKNRFNVLFELFKIREAFPVVYGMMAAVDTFGSSTAICECSCSFSALERVGVSNRISVTEDRLRNLTFLAYEKKRVAKFYLLTRYYAAK
ncbi:Zinc finger protein [Pseudolycoriella hygida]|uniref:Zinc finger protein n=1 Tax=Pseudolycoriella hygida TaxID=35572 RepID=A0A9Q0MXF4_9DIPT|nr:Zinc finger protein [Pseudolycoriella hygida]